jgi:hypothetical protein
VLLFDIPVVPVLTSHVVSTAANSIEQAAAPVDEADSPLLAHAPGTILRRTQRTKIRKASLPGDGGGHRFPATRRTRLGAGADAAPSVEDADRRTSAGSLVSSDGEHSGKDLQRFSPEKESHTRSVSAESVLDAYGPSRDSFISTTSSDSDDRPLAKRPSSPEAPSKPERSGTAPAIVAPQPTLPPSSPPLVQVQEPPESEDLLGVPSSERIKRVPSPGTEPNGRAEPPSDLGRLGSVSPTQSEEASSDVATTTQSTPAMPANVHPQYPSLPPGAGLLPPQMFRPVSPPRERPSSLKGKKGWARLGLSRSSADDGEGEEKKSKKDKKAAKSTDDASGKSETKDSGFFGGLFSTKKKHDHSESSSQIQPIQMAVSPTASGMLGQGGRYMNFYRLPIHVERAVYRLSHIKLANPRRPLYEQVLISNLMFWYLSVINKPPTGGTTKGTSSPSAPGSPVASGSGPPADAPPVSQPQEVVDTTPAAPAPIDLPSPVQQPAPTSKKSLTKHGPDSRRRTEVAVRPAQYGQHLVDMEEERGDHRPHSHPPSKQQAAVRERDPVASSSTNIGSPPKTSAAPSSSNHFVAPVPISTRPSDDTGFQVMRPRRRAPSLPAASEPPATTVPRPEKVPEVFDSSEHAWLASLANPESDVLSSVNGRPLSAPDLGDPLDIISSYSTSEATAAAAAAAASDELQARRQRDASLRDGPPKGEKLVDGERSPVRSHSVASSPRVSEDKARTPPKKS